MAKIIFLKSWIVYFKYIRQIDDMNITFDMEVKSAESSESSSDSLCAHQRFQYARGTEKEYAVLGKEIVGRDTSIIGKICSITLQM